MLRTFYDFDRKLRSLKDEEGRQHIFKRYSSLSALPFDGLHFKSECTDEMIDHYERMLTKRLVSKFAMPAWVRSDHGPLLNVDEALEGVPECYRTTRPNKNVLKLGLNVSGDFNTSEDIFAIRAAAIIAIYNLAKQRGQKVQFDVCYGFYGFGLSGIQKYGHYRIHIETPTPSLIKSVMTVEFRQEMIYHIVKKECHDAGYRLWKLSEDHPELNQEFDFVLDRIETKDKDIEYQRILSQIEKLRNK